MRLWAGLQVTKTLIDPKNGVKPGTKFVGVWDCTLDDVDYAGRFSVEAGASQTLFTPADQRVPATSVCTVTEDTLNPDDLVDGSFAWGKPTYAPDDVTLVTGETADLGIHNSTDPGVLRRPHDKTVTGPAPDSSIRSGRSPEPSPAATRPTTRSRRAGRPRPAPRSCSPGVLVGSVCSAVEDPPGATGQPVDGDPSYIWLDPVINGPVIVTPPEEPTPPIAVTNPTGRLFGTFTVTKKVVGATEGIVDPSAPYPMTYSCQPGSGQPITGTLNVAVGVTRTVGPEQEIPIESMCTLTEPADTLPALTDPAWTWADPTFTLDGKAATGTDRSVTFTIPTPQEDTPSPNVAVGVTNTVNRSSGTYTLTKSSDPPSGSTVKPGSTITYTLTARNTSKKSVVGATVGDDMSKVLPYATLVTPLADGLTRSGTTLTWRVPTIPVGGTVKVRYAVTVKADAVGVTLTNIATPKDPGGVCASCILAQTTQLGWTLQKTADPASGTDVDPGSTITYTLTARNGGNTVLAGAVATDDLRKVTPFADVATPLPAGLTRSGTTLTWAIPDIPVGRSVSVRFSVTVHDNAQNVTVANHASVASEGGRCTRCSTHNHVPAGAFLAATGVPLDRLLGWASALVLLGGLLLIAGRRRRIE